MSRLIEPWLPAGLRRLISLQLKAVGRAAIARLSTASGLAVALFIVGFGVACIAIRQLDLGSQFLVSPDTVARFGPGGMALFWGAQVLLRGGGERLGFAPSERDQLFAAPLEPHQLLIYKLVTMTVTWGVAGVMLSPMVSLYAQHGLGGLLVCWLVLPFLQLSSMVTALLTDSRRGWLAHIAITLALLSASLGGVSNGPMSVIANHPLTQVFRSPFVAASTLMSASQGVTLIAPSLGLAALNALLMVAVLWLGQRSWLELATVGADQFGDRARRVQTGGIAAIGGVWKVAVPPLPRWGGVGPIAWRRMVEIVRRPATFVALAGVVALVGITSVGMRIWGEVEPPAAAITGVGSLVWCLQLIPGTLRFDFRADLDRIDQLLALPIPSVAIVLGQCLPMAGLMTVTSWVVLAGLAVWQPDLGMLWLIGAWVVPFLAWFNVSVENLLFLFLPVRIQNGEAMLQSIGRNLITSLGAWFIEAMVLAAGAGLGAGLWLGLGSVPLAAIFSIIPLIVGIITCSLGAGWRLRRFDVSRHVPA